MAKELNIIFNIIYWVFNHLQNSVIIVKKIFKLISIIWNKALITTRIPEMLGRFFKFE